MPERARVFTRSEQVARDLAETWPAHRFVEVKGLAVPDPGLFVARVPESVWHDPDPDSPGPGSSGPDSPGAVSVDFVAAGERLGWITSVAPPASVVARLAAFESPVAYYHQMERGDDLYYEFALLCGGGAEPELVIRQTWVQDPDDGCSLGYRAGRSVDPRRMSSLEAVWVHLDLAPTVQFFWPEDDIPEDAWPPLD